MQEVGETKRRDGKNSFNPHGGQRSGRARNSCGAFQPVFEPGDEDLAALAAAVR
jgi:hypothetical protein